MNAQVQQALSYIRSKTDFVPEIAITLGSGLGSYASEIRIECEIPYSEIPEFPVSTVAGHDGRFIMGYVGEVPVICMKGRVHLYEGYTVEEVVRPVRIMHAMGAKILFLTNASGGINASYRAGSLSMITDHISSFVTNPLIGKNDEEEGVRFPDMSEVYDKTLRTVLSNAAEEEQIDLKEGVYVQLTGPSFETPAEIRMLKAVGADMVGMSTVVEAITARHCGMRVCGVSLISNLASGISPDPLSHEEVAQAGILAEPVFKRLVSRAVKMMGEQKPLK